MFEIFRCHGCNTKVAENETDSEGYYTCRRCRSVNGCPTQCDNGMLYRGALRWACPTCDAGADTWIVMQTDSTLHLEAM